MCRHERSEQPTQQRQAGHTGVRQMEGHRVPAQPGVTRPRSSSALRGCGGITLGTQAPGTRSQHVSQSHDLGDFSSSVLDKEGL